MSSSTPASTREGAGLTVAVVGVGSFGLFFIPMYLHHPDVQRVVLCDPDVTRLAAVAQAYGIEDTTTDLDAVLAMPSVDAVHLLTPMQLHAAQAIATLDAGKHCACAVPMGLTLDELHDVVDAESRSGKNYMMMETAVYNREFLHAKELLDSGQLGRLQFLRGPHYSDYEHWPSWKWYAPMLYATHAVAPLLRLAGTRASTVRCLGSGWMPDTLRGPLDNPYPVETAIFELEGSDAAAEVTRTCFRTIREVQESFSVYGDLLSFEWQQLAGEEPLEFRIREAGGRASSRTVEELEKMGETLGIAPTTLEELLPIARFPSVDARRVSTEDRSGLLPKELRRFENHGGAGPLLVHEFVRSIVEHRPSAISGGVSADWTAPGICAHESASHGGAVVEILAFDDEISPPSAVPSR